MSIWFLVEHDQLTSVFETIKWSEVVAVGQTFRSIFSQTGLQVLNVSVTFTLSASTFNCYTDHGRECEIALGHWHCRLGLLTGIDISNPRALSSLACFADQGANHLHHCHCGSEIAQKWQRSYTTVATNLHHRGDELAQLWRRTCTTVATNLRNCGDELTQP